MPSRFGPIFAMLMACAFISSVWMPRSFTDRVTASVGLLSLPIAWVGGLFGVGPVAPTVSEATPADQATAAAELIALRVERDLLLQRVAALESQHARGPSPFTSDRNPLIAPTTRAIAVVGADVSGRGVLRLAPVRVSIRPGTVAWVDAGIVGRVAAVGVGNQAEVRLLTDRASRVLVEFVRPVGRADGATELARLALDPTVMQGRGPGENEMVVDGLGLEAVQRAGVRPGDWVVLRHQIDPDPWPAAFQGRRVGVVTAVNQRVGQAGFADIRIRPGVDLMALREVNLDIVE